MSALALPGMALLLLGWLAAAAAGLGAPQRAARGALMVAGLGVVLALAYLLAGAPAVGLALPIGLPGHAMRLALDGLSGFFLLLLMVGAAAASAATLAEPPSAAAPLLPVFIAAMALCLLAGDGFTLVAGFELMSLASFVLVLSHAGEGEGRAAALLYFGIGLLGAVCLIPALALLGGWDAGFAELRGHPVEGWRAASVLALVLVGAGSKAGFAPLHVWLPPAHAAAPGPVSALMSGVMTKVALYVLVRLLFDLAGPQPIWWSVPLLVVGAASAALGALRANMETDIKRLLACSTIENVGLIAIGLGVALAARAADMLPLAALAFGAALLHALAHSWFKALLFLGAGATQHGAGSRELDRLGGLILRMPLTTAAMLLGAASLAALPPSSGFAGEWALFQAVIAGPRVAGLGMQVLFAVVAAVMALAVALAAAASVRLIGVGYLGRPRTPRAAAADEAAPPMRWALLGLGAASLAVGLFPGAVLGLAGPALALLVHAAPPLAAGGMVLTPGHDAAGYAPLAAFVLLALAGALVWWAVRRVCAGGHRRAPLWDCGYGEPPAWLPFGDPAMQYSAAGFSQPLRRTLGAELLAAREAVDMPAPGETRPATLAVTLSDPAERFLFAPVGRWRDRLSGFADRMQFLTIRRTLAVMASVLVVLLVLVGMFEQR